MLTKTHNYNYADNERNGFVIHKYNENGLQFTKEYKKKAVILIIFNLFFWGGGGISDLTENFFFKNDEYRK